MRAPENVVGTRPAQKKSLQTENANLCSLSRIVLSRIVLGIIQGRGIVSWDSLNVRVGLFCKHQSVYGTTAVGVEGLSPPKEKKAPCSWEAAALFPPPRLEMLASCPAVPSLAGAPVPEGAGQRRNPCGGGLTI